MADLKAWPKLDSPSGPQSVNRSPLSTVTPINDVNEREEYMFFLIYSLLNTRQTFYRSGPASERHRNRASSDAPIPLTPKSRTRGQSLDQTFLGY
jgi:hypothetical protein